MNSSALARSPSKICGSLPINLSVGCGACPCTPTSAGCPPPGGPPPGGPPCGGPPPGGPIGGPIGSLLSGLSSPGPPPPGAGGASAKRCCGGAFDDAASY